jgi:hypothetical protein
MKSPHSNSHKLHPPFPDSLWQLMANADALTLFSLLPDPHSKSSGADRFHGYPVLGKVEVGASPRRAEILEVLHRGIFGDSIVKRCWDPHHGIRAVSGEQALDLVICFICECMQVFADCGSDKYEWADIGTAPESVLDGVLSAAGVRLAKRPK